MSGSVESYFAAVPDGRRDRLLLLHKLIRRLYPEAIVGFQYKMPTYRSGEDWVAIANQKNYISLYTCGAHHLEQFRAKYPRIRTGKGCINLKPGDELPIADIEQIVRHAMDHPKGR